MKEKSDLFSVKKGKENLETEVNNFSSLWSSFGFRQEQLCSWVDLGDQILDLECGAGDLLDLLVDRDIHYVGLDGSPRLIEVAQKKYPGQQFLVGDLLKVTFPSDTFDKAFALTFLRRLSSEEQQLDILNEVRRILKPAGLLFFRTWSPRDFNLFSKPKDLKCLTRKAGLEVVQQGELKLTETEKAFYFITQKI